MCLDHWFSETRLEFLAALRYTTQVYMFREESTFIMPRGGGCEDVKGGGTEIFSGIKGGL